MTDSILVNNFYPLGYFAQIDLAQSAPITGRFWASQEQLPPTEEYLIFDFGLSRAVNFMDFEVGAKPLDIEILYDSDGNGTYLPVEYSVNFDCTCATAYLPSSDAQPWIYAEYHFTLVQTQRIKVAFTRRTDAFPLVDSLPFAWSVDIRNARCAHLVTTLSDSYDESGVLITDGGADIFGNTYTTGLKRYDPENLTDLDTQTFWQSQANPSRFAVEALYFDLRAAYGAGDMNDLDQIPMTKIDLFSMSDLDAMVIEDGVVFDEIYIDPLTLGCDMHVYYSNDTTADFADKLWSPVPRHYVLKRGYHALPAPTKAKFVKLEFSNLAAQPYHTLEYPNLPPVTYRRYPTWVQNTFLSIFPPQFTDDFIDPVERVSVEPLDLFKNVKDKLNTSFTDVAFTPEVLIEDEQRVERFILDTTGQAQIDEAQATVETQIDFHSTVFWQTDLNQLLDPSRSLSRYVLQRGGTTGYTSWVAEEAAAPLTDATQQSTEDLSLANEEKQMPLMWFPRRCRHSYQVVQAQRPSKIAYYVAIKEISFHRRDYESMLDERFYIETLDDTDHVEFNEFTSADWRYVVGS